MKPLFFGKSINRDKQNLLKLLNLSTLKQKQQKF